MFTCCPKWIRAENYAKFLSSYWLIANAVIVFLLVAHALIIASGLGYSVRIDASCAGHRPAVRLPRNYLTRVEPNWFVGIRTPWTLSSDTVWRKTHRTGGLLMVIAGSCSRGGVLPRPRFLPCSSSRSSS